MGIDLGGIRIQISFIESKVCKYWSVIISDDMAYLKSSLLILARFSSYNLFDCVHLLEIILKDF